MLKALQVHCEANPAHTLQIQRNIVRNPITGSELEVMSADAATGFGALVDAILVDEIGNWANTDSSQRLWEMIVSTVSKKQSCVLECITNAGRLESWQWALSEAIREDAVRADPSWHFDNVRDIPTWITPRQLAEQKRLLTPGAYARLWENNWSSGTDTGISPADYEACNLLLGPQEHREQGYDLYIAATDLGWRHDRTGLVVLAYSFHRNQLALAHCDSWSPQDHGGELPLSVVEDALIDVHERFHSISLSSTRAKPLVYRSDYATGACRAAG